jgi:hypothetical protein
LHLMQGNDESARGMSTPELAHYADRSRKGSSGTGRTLIASNDGLRCGTMRPNRRTTSSPQRVSPV